MKEKTENFWQRHKIKILIGGSAFIGSAVLYILLKKKSGEIKLIGYPDLDSAIEEFKRLADINAWPVLRRSSNSESWEVYDELLGLGVKTERG